MWEGGGLAQSGLWLFQFSHLKHILDIETQKPLEVTFVETGPY